MYKVFVENGVSKCRGSYSKCHVCTDLIIADGVDEALKHIIDPHHRELAKPEAWCMLDQTKELEEIKSLSEAEYRQLFDNNITFKNNFYFCNFCCIKMYVSWLGVQNHIINKKHKESMKIDFEKLLDSGIYFKLQSYYCNPCQRRFKDIGTVYTHSLSKSHQERHKRQKNQELPAGQSRESVDKMKYENINDQKKIKKQILSEQCAAPVNKKIISDKRILDGNKLGKGSKRSTIHCKVCKYQASISGLYQHINTVSHLEKLHTANLNENLHITKGQEPNSPLKEYFFCSTCHIWLNTDETLLQCHCMYHLHRELPGLNYDIIKFDFVEDKVKIKCLLCNYEMNSDSELAHHIHTIAHLKQLQNNLLLIKNNREQEKLNYGNLEHLFEALLENKTIIKNNCIPEGNYFLCLMCDCSKPGNVDRNGYIYDFEKGSFPESHSQYHDDNNHLCKLTESFMCFKCFICDTSLPSIEHLIKHYASSNEHKLRYTNYLEQLNSLDQKNKLACKELKNDGILKKVQDKKPISVKEVQKPVKNSSPVNPGNTKPIQKPVPNEQVQKPAKMTILVNPNNVKPVQGKAVESYGYQKKELARESMSQYFYCKICVIYIPKYQTRYIQNHCLYHLQQDYPDMNNDIIKFSSKGDEIIMKCTLCNNQLHHMKHLHEHLKRYMHVRRIESLLVGIGKKFNSGQERKIFPEIQSSDSTQGFDPRADFLLESFCMLCYVPDGEAMNGCSRGFDYDVVPNHQHSSDERKLSRAISAKMAFDFYKCYLCNAACANKETLLEHFDKDPQHIHMIENYKKVAFKSKERPSPKHDKSKRGSDIEDSDHDQEADEDNESLSDDHNSEDEEAEGPSSSTVDQKYTKEKRKNSSQGCRRSQNLFNEDIQNYGLKYISLCIALAGSHYIYNFSAEEIDSMKSGLEVIFPSMKYKDSCICLACDYKLPLNPQNLYEHLQHENHVANFDELSSCESLLTASVETADDALNYFDLAKAGLLEDSDSEMFCAVCEQSFANSHESITRHLQLSHHQTNIERSKKIMNLLREEFFELLANFWYCSRHFYCVPCKLVLLDELNFVRHLEQPKHLEKLKKKPSAEYKIDKCLACCSCWFGPTQAYSEHCKEFFHKDRSHREELAMPRLNGVSKKMLAKLADVANVSAELLSESDQVMRQDLDRENLLLLHIVLTVKPLYPQVQAYCFGSRCAGLGLFESDMDVFVDLNSMYHEKGSKQVSQRYIKRVTTLFFNANTVRIWRREMVLLTPRVPIIKLDHKPTRIKCDMSFLNGLGVEKSLFIRKFVMAYKNCRVLILYLKKWFEAVLLYGPRAINAYAITWFTIFYLQSLDIFPSVHELKQGSAVKIVDGWECGFPNKITVGTNASKYSFEYLLRGFFSFYANFDYHTCVVCPLLGKIVRKSDFVDIDSMPEEMDVYQYRLGTEDLEYFRYDSPMCIQDPIDLSQNITKGVKKKQLVLFIQYCKKQEQSLTKGK